MRHEQIDPRHARDALFAITPPHDREEWRRIGCGALAAGLDVETLVEWSALGENFTGERDVRNAFRGVSPDGGIGIGSLWRPALKTGWRPPQAGEQRHRRPAQAQATPAMPRKALRQGMGAAEVWRRCKPAAATHGYIVAKQGTAEGLRVVPEGDPLQVAGLPMAGALVVPVLPLAGGEPVSLQFVPTPETAARWKADKRPAKLTLPGPMAGGAFTVGELVPGCTAYLCEGIGTAWACWKATGAAAVASFGWGRVRSVATELRQRDASARLVLVPDVGKEAEAETIAREVSAQFVTMPEGWPANADVNDLAQRDGFDVLEALLLAPKLPTHRFRLLGSADLHALPPLAWRVRGVLPAQGLASVYGPSGSGKSFLALDAAAAIADGAEWFGYRVKLAPVVYCVLEGEAGFRVRVAAWEQAKGRTLPAGLRLVLQPFKLTDLQDVEDLAAAVLTAGAGAVTILDTLNRAAPEADENASADMGRILEAAKALQRLTAGLVVVVHHTGKDATRGLRGHSSLFAALDAAVEVTREGDRREWKVAKAKDGEDGAGHPFRLEVVDLGDDDEGETVTSCVIAPDDSPQDVTRCERWSGSDTIRR